MNIYWNWPVVDGEAANVGGFQWQSRVRESDDTSWPPWLAESAITSSNTQRFEVTENVGTPPERQAFQTTPTGFDSEDDMYQVRVRAVRIHDDNPAAEALGAGSWVESSVITHQGTDGERATVNDSNARTAFTPNPGARPGNRFGR